MISSEALIPVNNLQHNVVTRQDRDPHTSLIALTEQYLG